MEIECERIETFLAKFFRAFQTLKSKSFGICVTNVGGRLLREGEIFQGDISIREKEEEKRKRRKRDFDAVEIMMHT